MSQPVDTRQEVNLSDGGDAGSQLDFLALYDRYAPALLGVITRMVTDKTEAVGLLERTFVKVRLELSRFGHRQQPLFAWLLGIARCTALEAIGQRTQLPAPVFQLTSSGQVVALPGRVVALQADFCTDSTDAALNELLESVLYTNCTPEEAAVKVGMPVETARQQLRLAMQQLRAQSKL